MLTDFTKTVAKYIIWYIDDESEMTLWDVNGTTLKRKSQKDKNTSRIYAKFGKEIYVAAKSSEPNPESNQTLRLVLERAKHIQYLIIL